MRYDDPRPFTRTKRVQRHSERPPAKDFGDREFEVRSLESNMEKVQRATYQPF